MIDLTKRYQEFCESKGVSFKLDDRVNPYDETTLFCPAGMQQFKKDFANQELKGRTIANIQSCLRLNDYEEVGDGTHLLYFNMMGLFSFRDWTVPQTIDFWMEFLEKDLGLKVDYVTIHPDKMNDWKQYYKKYEVDVRPDPECTWSDGSEQTKPSYCTEFYINDVEIGNIVNPNGDCIDVGFGFERLEAILNHDDLDYRRKQERRMFDKRLCYLETIEKILQSGYRPGAMKQGYILRKLFRDLLKEGGTDGMKPEDLPSDEIMEMIEKEIGRQEKMLRRYRRLKPKHTDKDHDWWYTTHGIDVSLVPLNEEGEMI